MADAIRHRGVLGEWLDSFAGAERKVAEELRKPLRDRDCESVHWWVYRMAEVTGHIRANARKIRELHPEDPILDQAGSVEATMKAVRQKVGDKCVKAI